MNKVHYIFEAIPDVQAAEALSELVEPHTRFKDVRFLSPEMQDRYGTVSEFPPVPAYLSEVTIAYLEDSGLTRRQFTDVVQNPKVDHEAARADHLRASVQVDELKQTTLAGGDGHLVEEAHAIVIERIRDSGLRTIAALTTFSSVDTGEHFSSFFVPRKQAEQLPLELRSVLLAEGSDSDQLLEDEDLKESKRLIMTNDPQAGLIMGMLGSISMPGAEVVRKIMETTPAPSSKPQVNTNPEYEGLSRTERRRLEARERRQQRRKGTA